MMKDSDVNMKDSFPLLDARKQSEYLDNINISTRAKLKMLVRAYFHQITKGCILKQCNNPYCSSNMKPQNDTEAAKLAITLAKKAFEKDPQYFFCNTLNVVLPNFSSPTDVCIQPECLTMLMEDKDTTVLVDIIKRVFSNEESLTYSFLTQEALRNEVNYSSKNSGVDIEAVDQSYKLLLKNETISSALSSSLDNLSQKLKEKAKKLNERNVRIFIIILECPLLMEPSSHEILSNLMQGILQLSTNALDSLKLKLSEVPKSYLSSFVSIFQQFITVQLYAKGYIDEKIAYATRILGILNAANEMKMNRFERVNYEEFYNDAVNNIVDIKEDYMRWARAQHIPNHGFECFNFCEYPYILDPGFKSKILQLDAELQQSKELRNAFISSLFRQPTSLFCVLKVDRHNLLQTALNEIMLKAEDLKKQLRVKFIGEEGIDEGGVRKEFFQLIVRQIFDVNYGMFEYNEETRSFWFNANSFESQDDFKLIGTVIGLAIYNSIILDTHFPNVVYKKMLGFKPNFEDFKEAFPKLGRGLQQLLDFEGDVEDVFCRTFQVETEVFGHKVTHDLKPNGGNIYVTNQNRQEYVDLLVEWTLEKSILQQFNAFMEGFRMVCSDPTILNLFRPEELDLLICGSPVLDFEALERTTRYADGYDKDDPLIKDFWDVVHHFTEEEKKKFLMFCTGSDRVPIKGLGELGFVIVRNGDDDTRLPTAHTCFNHLLLPRYSSKEYLRERLLTAINNCMGFGLQ
ncbi:hypothetical protein ABK040_010187 [Willaertia magna]